ncbi:pectin lyase fold/virulence factor [Crucibulum laeve]|uniref:galacturonan 1,4-alpha-galacturonidase n=1 Tax=Crucibulum laeve TaxID=68775 RepID=A0A5C3LG40_9AGAR|nr:pectin lyase fold/virulence factor [Crucibulum laeve]
MRLIYFLGLALSSCSVLGKVVPPSRTCSVRPLGKGRDDTTQVEAAIATCGQFGSTVFEEGTFNITRKMTWNLQSSKVDLKGFLSFNPDIQFWLNPNNTYRVVFIQSQASWFVVTGDNFIIDAHNTGGIQGNGQTWWSYFATHTKADGDGRPISLTVFNATRATIKNFKILSPPFWSNTVAQSREIVYDGMFVNASNQDPLYVGKNVVPNTDGINTYRSDNVSLLNWDVTCGDDCLAIKGNSTNILARNITCRGGNGIAFGSLGQYANLSDIVQNVEMDNLLITRIDPNVQPNMANGIYFKSWTGTANGVPPTAGGGGGGFVNNVIASNVKLDRVNAPLHLYQTNGGHSADLPSQLSFGGLHFANWSGTALTNKIIDIECSPAVGCADITFESFTVSAPAGQSPRFICQNTDDVTGLSAPCNATGQA